uniref:Transposase, MuDR n=1 Tax=Tanacetum cinerariifolium TaxID=118510 RepID=A0A6L2KF06_TANCI|nr:transposase, MuDR [Tanacetum cinerariifolium]
MHQWLVCEEHEVDVTIYDTYKEFFSVNVHHGGSFTPKGGMEYILGDISFVDLLDVNGFSVHTVGDIVKELGYSEIEVRYYHFMIPGNPPLLRSGEILWVDKEDYEEDSGCGSSKGKEPEVDASGNEAQHFDPFENLDDILEQYAKDNIAEAESH